MSITNTTSLVTVVQSTPQLGKPKCYLPILPNDIIKEIFLILKNKTSDKSERRNWKILFRLTSKSCATVIDSVSGNIDWSSKNMKGTRWFLKCQLSAQIKDIFFAKFPFEPNKFVEAGEKYEICKQLPWVKQEFKIPEKKIIDNEMKEVASSALSIISKLSKELFISSYQLSGESGQQFENALQILLQIKGGIFQPAPTSTPTLDLLPDERSGSGEKILQLFARALKRCDKENPLPVEQVVKFNITQTEEIQKIVKMNPAALPFMMKIILSLYSRIHDIEFENEITTLFTECIKLWNSNERIYLGTLLEVWIKELNENKHNPKKFDLLNELCENPANRVDPMTLFLVCKKIPLWEDKQALQQIKLLLEEIKFPKELRKILLRYFLNNINKINWLSDKNIPSPVDDFIFFLEKVDPQLPDIKLLRIIQKIKSHKDVDVKSDLLIYLKSKYGKHHSMLEKNLMSVCERGVLDHLNITDLPRFFNDDNKKILEDYQKFSRTPSDVVKIDPNHLFEFDSHTLPCIVNAILKPHKTISLDLPHKDTLDNLTYFIKKGIDFLFMIGNQIPLRNALDMLLKSEDNLLPECLNRVLKDQNSISPDIFFSQKSIPHLSNCFFFSPSKKSDPAKSKRDKNLP